MFLVKKKTGINISLLVQSWLLKGHHKECVNNSFKASTVVNSFNADLCVLLTFYCLLFIHLPVDILLTCIQSGAFNFYCDQWFVRQLCFMEVDNILFLINWI